VGRKGTRISCFIALQIPDNAAGLQRENTYSPFLGHNEAMFTGITLMACGAPLSPVVQNSPGRERGVKPEWSVKSP